MADFDLPDDLIAAQRAYDEADARVEEVTATLPSSVAVLAGEAEFTDEQRAALAEARAERLMRLTGLIDHPWWQSVDNKLDAQKQLRSAARALS
ncbi:hypothetical protein ACFXJ8_08340 [Nonomuraea sp. NPDC059194]|uniref:hypothetical protein n=1 Tax=Nonomuraea sp. NPDC059194 TaxID=3346764 RepID=UPI0036CF8C79